MVVAFAVACGGGVVRDLCIGAVPPAGLADWRYLFVAMCAALMTILASWLVERLANPVIFFDSLGLGLFAVTGAQKALIFGHNAEVAVLLGVVSAVGGGVIRDAAQPRARHPAAGDLCVGSVGRCGDCRRWGSVGPGLESAYLDRTPRLLRAAIPVAALQVEPSASRWRGGCNDRREPSLTLGGYESASRTARARREKPGSWNRAQWAAFGRTLGGCRPRCDRLLCRNVIGAANVAERSRRHSADLLD